MKLWLKKIRYSFLTWSKMQICSSGFESLSIVILLDDLLADKIHFLDGWSCSEFLLVLKKYAYEEKQIIFPKGKQKILHWNASLLHFKMRIAMYLLPYGQDYVVLDNIMFKNYWARTIKFTVFWRIWKRCFLTHHPEFWTQLIKMFMV